MISQPSGGGERGVRGVPILLKLWVSTLPPLREWVPPQDAQLGTVPQWTEGRWLFFDGLRIVVGEGREGVAV